MSDFNVHDDVHREAMHHRNDDLGLGRGRTKGERAHGNDDHGCCPHGNDASDCGACSMSAAIDAYDAGLLDD